MDIPQEQKSKFWAQFGWATAQAAVFGLAWAGMHGTIWAWNIYIFFAWIFTVFYILAAMGANTEAIKSQHRKVPLWLSCATDMVLAGMLSAFGHFGYAILKIIEQMGEQVMYPPTNKEEKQISQ